MKILLVDDLEANLLLLEMVLKSRGHAVETARDGREALEAARREPPGLVIADILMPVLDGYALCRAWTADPVLAAIPFIFYTATYTSAEDEAFALSLGAAAFLRKPMEPVPFLEEVAKVVARTQGGALRAPEPDPPDEASYLKLYNERLVQKLDQRSRNLTERVDQLERMEAELRLKGFALDAAANGIAILDQEGRVEWANAAFHDLAGFPEVELSGRVPALLSEAGPDLWETLRSGRVWRGELGSGGEGGTGRRFEAAITPLAGPSGFVAIMQDITLQRRAEEELQHAQRMEAVGRLAGGIAHDFNNMLNVILINAEVALEDEGLADRHRHHLQEIQAAANRSSDLTRQLLAFSRKQPAQPRRVDLARVIEDNRKMLHRLIEGDIDLTFQTASSLAPVRVDPSQVSQILTNLVINARDALPGAGTICVATSNVRVEPSMGPAYGGARPGAYVRLSVSDNGCGMDAFIRQRIFEPFFTTKGEGQGTGLGLSTVYGIVKQNGGTIDVYSHPGLGTTFKIYFPVAEGEEDQAVPETGERSQGGEETLLVAEDEPPMLEVVRIVLEGLGYRVLAARTPIEAVELAERHSGPIHLLLTDLVMPGMNGREMHERILALRPTIKVLFMSGYSGDILAKRGLIPEEIPFLPKPFGSRDLAAKVREALDR